MSQQGRNEAKRLRRLKRKQDLNKGSATNSIGASGLTVAGGGTLAVIAIALGVNALVPSGQSPSSQDSTSAPTEASQSPSPSPSASASKTPDFFSDTVAGVSGIFKISITASPSASPSSSASPSPTPSGVTQGSYYAEGRYGSGYYSTAYDVAFSSPMFQAGSGSYYGTSGYDTAIESPHGYYSDGGWHGTGFYESGYFDLSGYYDFSGFTGYWNGPSGYYDLSGNTGMYGGSWDGSGITYPYGSGAYFGASGFSSAEYDRHGSYFPSGFFGSGYYTNIFFDFSQSSQGFAAGTGSYYGVSGLSEAQDSPHGFYSQGGWNGTGYYESGYYDFSGNVGGTWFTNFWNGQPLGVGNYYGVSGYGTPQAPPSGTYYSNGWTGAGYYASSVCSYEYMPGMCMGMYQGAGSYYGTSGYGTPQIEPTRAGSYYSNGWTGSGYYASSSYDMMYGSRGAGSYYGTNGFGTPQAGPAGVYYSNGWTGAGYYASSVCSYEYMPGMCMGMYQGAGSYYGTSGYGTPQSEPTRAGSYYSTGFAGPGYYASSVCSYEYMPGMCMGMYQGAGTYYGTSGYGTPQAPPAGRYYSTGFAGPGYYASSSCSYEYMPGMCMGSYQGAGSYYGTSGYGTPQAPPVGVYYSSGWTGAGYYASGYNYGGSCNGYCATPVGTGTYFGVSGYDNPVSEPI